MNVQAYEELSYYPMTVSEEHSAWHAANGRWGCPWDCAASDAGADEDYETAPAVWIKCGSCKEYHASVAEVRDCCLPEAYAPF